jgi:hypothetical protein
VVGDARARVAILRLARALKDNDNVDSVHGHKQDGHWNAWVVVRDRSWEAESPVFLAHVRVDPHFYLTMHVTTQREQVPAAVKAGLDSPKTAGIIPSYRPL